MEKKGLFTGWKDVFSFTATQELKGGKYKFLTIPFSVVKGDLTLFLAHSRAIQIVC